MNGINTPAVATRALAVRMAGVAVVGSAAGAFASAAPFIAPPQRSAPLSATYEWDLFGDPATQANEVFVSATPDVTAPANNLAGATISEVSGNGSALLTSTGNIYMGGGLAQVVIELPAAGLGGAIATSDVLLQVRTDGVDYLPSNFTINGQPADAVTELELVTRSFQTPGGTFFSTTRSSLLSWRVSTTGPIEIRFQHFGQLFTPVSVDRVAVDVRPFNASCPADLNGDGAATIFDIFAYFAEFGAGRGNFNDDAASDIFDIIGFFASFGGC